MTERNDAADTVEELDPDDLREPTSALTPHDFDSKVRQLIDLAIQSGIDPGEVEAILDRHATGVEFYYEDAYRYTTQEE